MSVAAYEWTLDSFGHDKEQSARTDPMRARRSDAPPLTLGRFWRIFPVAARYDSQGFFSELIGSLGLGRGSRALNLLIFAWSADLRS